MIKKLLDYLNIKIVGTECGDEYKCVCPVCGTDHLRINMNTGQWKCLKGCASGNLFLLVRLVTKKEDKEIFEILKQCGITMDGTRTFEQKPKEKKLSITAADIRKITPDEIQQVCASKRIEQEALYKFEPYMLKSEPIMLLPAWLPSDLNHACGFMRVRLDGEKIKLPNGREEKYPMVDGSIHGLLGLRWIFKENPSELIFGEAWRDALAAIGHGFYATASTGGASCFKDGSTAIIYNGKEIRPDWRPAFKDRKVWIFMDEDAAGNGGWITNKENGKNKVCLKGAAFRAANKIFPIANETRIGRLPFQWKESHGNDLYDFLQNHTKDDLCLLIKQSPSFVAADEQTRENTPTEHGVGKGVVVLKDDHPDTIAIGFEQWSRKDCNIQHKYQPCDDWTMFKDGKYQTIDEKTQLWRYISQFTNRCIFQRGKNKERVSVTTKKLTDIARQLSFLNDVYLRPKQVAPYSLDGTLDPNHIIALQNGLLDWRGHPYILHPCSQQYYTLNYLPYSWQGEKDSELWIRFLIDATNGDEELFDLLQQWAGYCLMKNNQTEQRFMIAYGEASTGKSVFVDVLTHLLGHENVAAIPLEKFDDPHYVVQTYGKLLNVTDESESQLEEAIETHLKHYTGGTVYTFKRLYQESFTAYPTAKIMIVTNHLPSFKDTSDGVWRRLLIAPFDNVISEEKRIKGLAQKIIATEMPGVLKWALEGARKVEKFGFVIPKICQQRVAEYRREAIPEYTFFEENFEAGNPKDEDVRVRCDLVRSCYEQWCKAQGIGAKSQKKLSKTFKKLFPLYDRRRGRDGLQLTYFYYGVRMSQESEFVNASAN